MLVVARFRFAVKLLGVILSLIAVGVVQEVLAELRVDLVGHAVVTQPAIQLERVHLSVRFLV